MPITTIRKRIISIRNRKNKEIGKVKRKILTSYNIKKQKDINFIYYKNKKQKIYISFQKPKYRCFPYGFPSSKYKLHFI